MNFFRSIIFILLFLSTSLSAGHKDFQHVSVQLEWKHQFEFAGFYAALEQGYYKDVDLDVEIKEYHSNIDVVNDVLSGISTYGMSSSHLILERLSGKKIIQLASYLKQNALVLIAKPNIKTIKDLKNKKVMASTNELKGTSLAAMFQEHHLNTNDIDVIPHSFNIDAFANGDIDAMTAFISNQPFLLDQKQIPYKIFNPSEDGIFSYDVELFTSKGEAKNNPLRTQKFIDATRKGWEYALSHKDEIIELIYQKYSKEKSREALLYEANIIHKLMKTDLFKIGAVVPELTRLNTNMYVQLGMADKHWDLEGFVFDPKPRQINLTFAESAFIKAHPVIRFSDVQWEPFASITDDNKYSGIFKAYYALLEQRTGIKFEFIKIGDGINFQLVLDALKRKEIDMIDGSGKTKERKNYALFAGPLMQVSLAIVSNKENRFTTMESLKNKHIAVAKGSTASEYLKEHFPQIDLIYTNSIDEALNLVTDQKADAGLDNLVVLDYIIKNNPHFNQVKISGISDYKFDLYALIRDDYTLLHQIMNKAVKSISQEELLSINNKLLQSTVQTTRSQRDFLTQKEKAYIKNHLTLTVGNDKNWPPFDFYENSQAKGFSVDYIKEIGRLTGLKFDFVQDKNWKLLINKLKNKELDILTALEPTAKNKKFALFSDDILITLESMVIRDDYPAPNSYKDLYGKRVGVIKGYDFEDEIRKNHTLINMVLFDTPLEALRALSDNKIDVFLENSAVSLYLINKHFLTNLKLSSSPKFPNIDNGDKINISSRIDHPQLHSIIQKAIKAMPDKTIKSLHDKWMSKIKNSSKKNKIILTKDEQSYLKKKKKITMCINPNWMPFEKIENGKHTGMSAEYIQLISSKINLPITLIPTKTWGDSVAFAKERKCDILSLAMETPERKKFMDFTKPYITVPLVIATDNDKSFISDISELQGKQVGVVKGYAPIKLLKHKYPKINFVEVDTLEEGLHQVAKGKLFGFIDSLTTIGHQIQKRFPRKLKITGQLNEKVALGIGVRNDESALLSILEKAVDSVEEKKKQNILNQWIPVKYEHGYDYILFWKILSPFLLLALILFISQYILRQYNMKLRNEVAQKVEELRQKDALLLKKYRMAAMGEMLSMIAHQWRQPLAAISSAVMGIEVKIASGKFDLNDQNDREKFLAFLERKHHSINDYVQFLSTTTDDFRNFFNPDKSRDSVSLTVPIENALNIVQTPMQNNGIEIIKEYQVDESLPLYKNEIMQVMLNLLKNSEDNFLAKKISDPKITIATRSDGNTFIISICDNGKGIPEDIIDKIFDPYFSTKDEKNGTGLGLYMSKIMIEDHHKGILNVRNSEDGVCFEIIFKKQIIE